MAAWIRLPFPFVDGEETSPFVHLMALSDFANLVGGQFGQRSRTFPFESLECPLRGIP